MSSTAKGVIVAAIDLFAIALLIAILEANERHWTRDALDNLLIVQVLGAIPALALGAALGWLAGRLDVARAPILVGIGLACVIAGGLITEPRWIYVAALPTVIWMVRLERWTRRKGDQPKPEMSPIACGAILTGSALAAIAVIVGLVMRYDRHRNHTGLEVALETFVAGLGPSLALGAGLGWIARQLAATSRHVRRLVLCAPLVAVIVLLGAATDESLVLPTLVPAVASMLLLERVTRSHLPVARVLPARPGNQGSGAAI